MAIFRNTFWLRIDKLLCEAAAPQRHNLRHFVVVVRGARARQEVEDPFRPSAVAELLPLRRSLLAFDEVRPRPCPY